MFVDLLCFAGVYYFAGTTGVLVLAVLNIVTLLNRK
jgi:hypothetical protein